MAARAERVARSGALDGAARHYPRREEQHPNAPPIDVPSPPGVERWLTFREAEDELGRLGLLTTWRYLEKLADGGRGMPSTINFGKRQVRLSQILPWLKDQGYIERDVA